MASHLAIIDVESRRLLAVHVDPARAARVGAQLGPRYAVVDEETWDRIRRSWDAELEVLSAR